jgi:hypothetical protein
VSNSRGKFSRSIYLEPLRTAPLPALWAPAAPAFEPAPTEPDPGVRVGPDAPLPTALDPRVALASWRPFPDGVAPPSALVAPAAPAPLELVPVPGVTAPGEAMPLPTVPAADVPPFVVAEV